MIHATPPRLSRSTRVPTAKTEAPEPIARTEADLGKLMKASVPPWAKPKKTPKHNTPQPRQRYERILAACDDWITAEEMQATVCKDLHVRTVRDYLRRMTNEGILDKRGSGMGQEAFEFRRGTGKVIVKTATDAMLARDAKILAHVTNWTPAREVAAAFGVSQSTAVAALKRGMAQGKIEKQMRKTNKASVPMYRRIKA